MCHPSSRGSAFDGEAHDHRSANAVLADPAAFAHQLIEGAVEARGVSRQAERLGVLAAEPHDRTRPAVGRVWGEPELVPQQGAALIG